MTDEELKQLLDGWQAPEVPGTLEGRIWRAWERQRRKSSVLGWLSAGTVRVPVPVCALAVILVLTLAVVARGPAQMPPVPLPPPAPHIVRVPVFQERVVVRTVYRTAGLREGGSGYARSPHVAQARMSDFQPVAELAPRIIREDHRDQ